MFMKGLEQIIQCRIGAEVARDQALVDRSHEGQKISTSGLPNVGNS